MLLFSSWSNEEIIYCTYPYFVFLGIASFLSYYALMGSVNYWQYFYGTTFTTITAFIASIGEFAGTVSSYTLFKKLTPTYQIAIAFSLNTVSLISILGLYFASYYVRYYISFFPIFFCGFGSGQFYSVMVRTGSRIDKLNS